MSCLIIVDMQNDFITGSLAVKDSDVLIQRINDLLEENERKTSFDFIVYTKDNHPENHISFNNSNLLTDKEIDSKLNDLSRKFKGVFPPHCVVETLGNEFHSKLNTKKVDLLVLKGENKFKEEFSGFENPILNDFLLKNKVKKVFVCGLSFDFCVGSTAIDSAEREYETYVISNLTFSITPESENEMKKTLNEKKVALINSTR